LGADVSVSLPVRVVRSEDGYYVRAKDGAPLALARTKDGAPVSVVAVEGKRGRGSGPARIKDVVAEWVPHGGQPSDGESETTIWGGIPVWGGEMLYSLKGFEGVLVEDVEDVEDAE